MLSHTTSPATRKSVHQASSPTRVRKPRFALPDVPVALCRSLNQLLFGKRSLWSHLQDTGPTYHPAGLPRLTPLLPHFAATCMPPPAARKPPPSGHPTSSLPRRLPIRGGTRTHMRMHTHAYTCANAHGSQIPNESLGLPVSTATAVTCAP